MDDELDLTESIQPRSDQINADDLIAGPITYTIREVTKGGAEQPFDFLLVETDRAYRPSKTMRRVIVAAWGPQAAIYAGGKLTLYREPSITFGGKVVGGIRISHMSNIDAPVEVSAQTTRGKREQFTVQPLGVPAAEPSGPLAEPLAAGPLPLNVQLRAMSLQDRADLYDLTGIEKGTPLGKVRETLHAVAKSFAQLDGNVYDDKGEPDAVQILADARKLKMESLPSDSAEAFDHFAKTGQDLSDDPQTVIT